MKKWPMDKIIDLIEKSLRNFFTTIPTKGCVMYSNESGLCQIHEHRSLACRTYGIMPEEEWRPKYVQLTVKYQDDVAAVFKEQCNLVSVKRGKPVTKKNTDAWWDELVAIEVDSGVREDMVKDDKGTYLTYHDHILKKMLPSIHLDNIGRVKQFGTIGEQEATIKTIISLLNQAYNKVAGDKK
jgi:hypothetical protein